MLPLADGHLLQQTERSVVMVDAADQPLPGGEVLEFRMVEAEAAPGGTHGVMFDREERLIWFQVAPPTFRPLGAHPMHHAAVGPGGWPLYLAHDDGVRVMLEDGTEAPFFASGSAIYVLAISSDGRWLAAGDRERTTWVLDRESGAVRARMRGHRRRVSTLAFSPDSRTLATGSWDDTIRFWDLGVFEADPAVLLAEAETRWGLTADEVLRGR